MLRSHLSLCVSLCAVVLGLTIGHCHANTVYVEPADQSVGVGALVTVQVLGTGFVTALDAGGLNIAFDDDVLRPALLPELPGGASAQAEYDAVWNTSFAPSLNGNVLEDAFFFADTAPSGDFAILTLYFVATGLGSSPIDITESALNPFAGGGGALAVTTLDGVVHVVPVPASLWLFGSVVLLAGVARSRSERMRARSDDGTHG